MPKPTPCHFMAGCFRYLKGEEMTWRVVHVSQSEKMRLKLDNLLVQKQSWALMHQGLGCTVT